MRGICHAGIGRGAAKREQHFLGGVLSGLICLTPALLRQVPALLCLLGRCLTSVQLRLWVKRIPPKPE
jgi:hypothetical protein